MAQPIPIQITKNKNKNENKLIRIAIKLCQKRGIKNPSDHLQFLLLQSWKQPASKTTRGDIRDSCIKNFFSAMEKNNRGKTPTFLDTNFSTVKLGSPLCDDMFNFMTLLFDSYSFHINDIVYIINLILTWTNRFPIEKSQVKADIIWNFLHRVFRL